MSLRIGLQRQTFLVSFAPRAAGALSAGSVELLLDVNVTLLKSLSAALEE